MDAYAIRFRMIALLAVTLVAAAPAYGQYRAGYSSGYQNCPCPPTNNGGQSQPQSRNRSESGVTITDQNQDTNGSDQNTNNQTDAQSQANDSNASENQNNGQSAEASTSNLSSTQTAGANPNMIGDFFGLPGRRNLFLSTHTFGVADPDPSAVPPSDRFKFISTVIPGSGFTFDTFGAYQIKHGENINNDGVKDFILVPIGNVGYAAISQFQAQVFGDPADVPPIREIYGIYEAFVIPNPSAGDLVGRVRLQDNNSALPQDRWFVDYDYFQGVPLTSQGANVNRLEPGFEKTFFNGNSSIEVRVPMALTVNSEFVADGPTDTSHAEFGDVVIAPKLLLQNSDLVTAVGCGVSLPTANDLNVQLSDSTPLLQVRNQSVHLMPYVAVYVPPIFDNFFAHVWVTGDFEANANTVYGNIDGQGLERMGRWQSQNLASIDAAIGSWLFRSPSCGRQRSHGLAWSTELHYTASLNDADFLHEGDLFVGNAGEKVSVLDATVGLHYQVGKAMLTAAYSAPVTDQRVFDGQFRLLFNRYLY